jgi:hypothetical protein
MRRGVGLVGQISRPLLQRVDRFLDAESSGTQSTDRVETTRA